MYEFDIERPASIAQAAKALSGDDALALGGGQTLIPTLKQRLAQPATLVSLGGIAEIQGISGGSGDLSVGGGTTHADVAAGAGDYPALAALAGNIGDPAVRNRGTIGGSLANNDPSADYPAAVLGSEAIIRTNLREISGDNFFNGLFETTLKDGEIITRVDFRVPGKAAYMKFDQPASRFALVGVFVAQYGHHVRVAVTGASENGVFRWPEAEAALAADFSAGALDGLSLDGGSMISDVHGSGDYRAHLVGVMTARAVAATG